MTSHSERMEVQDRINRAVKMATTYLHKAESWLRPYRGSEWGEIVQPPPPNAYYWDLLEQALSTAEAIVEHLPDEFFDSTDIQDFFALGLGGKHNSSDEPFELAEKVVAAFQRRRSDADRRRRIAALENVEGRTPEEQELYLAKAAKLRARSG